MKGPMITVEVDVKKTLNENILPRQQELIPVALKRKFIYKENCMEKIVDKGKVQKYFEYFKNVNPLFGNQDETRIDELIETVIGDHENAVLIQGVIGESQIDPDTTSTQCQDCKKLKSSYLMKIWKLKMTSKMKLMNMSMTMLQCEILSIKKQIMEIV